MSDALGGGRQRLRLFGGLIPVFALFHLVATALGSDRGQAGVAVAGLVLAALFAVERALFGSSPRTAAHTLGLGRPRAAGLAAAVAGSLLLLAVLPVVAAATGSPVAARPGWGALLPGLFAQAGIAEETLFRGYLFGRLRRGRSFWRAVAASLPPFAAAHVILFFLMPWPIALASLGLSVVSTAPLARLYELGGSTIWAPALLHTVIQAVPKIVTIGAASDPSFPLAWIAASAALPLPVLCLRPAQEAVS